jgi:hypothetical protein
MSVDNNVQLIQFLHLNINICEFDISLIISVIQLSLQPKINRRRNQK